MTQIIDNRRAEKEDLFFEDLEVKEFFEFTATSSIDAICIKTDSDIYIPFDENPRNGHTCRPGVKVRRLNVTIVIDEVG